jgi:pimeloyl-ACP methyl ester carboxylesterase
VTNAFRSVSLALVLSGVGAIGLSGAALGHGSNHGPRREPIVVKEQGSFYVNGETIVTSFPSGVGNPAPGQTIIKQMYVQYQIPEKVKSLPVIMVHGSWHSGKTWDETPDGREGWQTYFLRKGIPVYVVDHVGRGRSGFNTAPSNQAKIQANPALIPNFATATFESGWSLFRIGPALLTPHPTSQFPTAAWTQYAAQLLPNAETSVEPGCSGFGNGCTLTINAIGALLDKIGPAVVMVHSQSGQFAFKAAVARPNLVKAVVGIEPTACPATDAEVAAVFKKVPVLTVFGDFIEGSVWANVMAGCVSTVNRVVAAGGKAENIHLPSIGIIGNSHMLMMDKNNGKVADVVIKWLDKKLGHHKHW